MNDMKGFFESKTVWAGLIGFFASIAGLFGYVVSAEDIDYLAGVVPLGATAVSSLYAIYGRIKASKKIG